MASQTLCSDQTFIHSVEECKNAAQILGIPYAESGEWRASFDFEGCLAARDGRDKIYFNTATDLDTTAGAMHPNYHAICSSEINTVENKSYYGFCYPLTSNAFQLYRTLHIPFQVGLA